MILEQEFHSALRTIARMIHDDFRMHRARVFLSPLFLLLVLVIVFVARAIGVNRRYLCADAYRERHRANEKQNVSFHFRRL
jgi:hypothetical protein